MFTLEEPKAQVEYLNWVVYGHQIPATNAVVTIKHAIKMPGVPEVFTELSFTMGKEEVFTGFDEVITGMKIDQKAIITLPINIY